QSAEGAGRQIANRDGFHLSLQPARAGALNSG
ncbi:MAG: hypothetical protein RLZZ235_1885, partial [Pseudomonadota bacterium]